MMDYNNGSTSGIWGCVKYVLKDYGINTDNITNRVGAHLMSDMLQALISEGYLGVDSNVNENEDDRKDSGE